MLWHIPACRRCDIETLVNISGQICFSASRSLLSIHLCRPRVITEAQNININLLPVHARDNYIKRTYNFSPNPIIIPHHLDDIHERNVRTHFDNTLTTLLCVCVLRSQYYFAMQSHARERVALAFLTSGAVRSAAFIILIPSIHPHTTPPHQCASSPCTSAACNGRPPRASPRTSSRRRRRAAAPSCCTTGWRATATDAARNAGSASSHITASPA